MITRPNPEERHDGLSAERPYLYGSWPGVALICLSMAMVSYAVGWLGFIVVCGALILAWVLIRRRRRSPGTSPTL